jgi:hypothetical protein
MDAFSRVDGNLRGPNERRTMEIFRKSLGLLATSCVLVNLAQGQTASQVSPAGASVPTAWTAASRTANSTVYQRTTYVKAPDGSPLPHTHRYVALGTGLNHLVNGQYAPSSDQIQLSTSGDSASATNSQHQAVFPGDIASGTITLVTPDGKTLEMQPIALSYFDGNNSVLLALVTNAVGEILPSGNQVMYTNAFMGLDADLLYKNTLAGLE